MAKLRVGILDFYNIQMAQRKVGVISRGKGNVLKKSRRGFMLLSEAIRKLGHTPVVYHPEHCELSFQTGKASILYKGKKMRGCDVLIPRINVTQNIQSEISVIRQFEMMGTPLVNHYVAINNALNKLLTLEALTANHIPVPKTVVVRRGIYVDGAVEKIGGYPVVVKSLFGTHGKGVALMESKRSLTSLLDILRKYSPTTVILLQEYIAEAHGEDYRAFVVGNQVVASMKRTSASGDFRSNLNLGGSAQPAELTDEEKSLAVRATRALDLDSSGVDILRTKHGPVVMEMNPCAGLAGITRTTGHDVAMDLVRYAVQKAVSAKTGSLSPSTVTLEAFPLTAASLSSDQPLSL